MRKQIYFLMASISLLICLANSSIVNAEDVFTTEYWPKKLASLKTLNAFADEVKWVYYFQDQTLAFDDEIDKTVVRSLIVQPIVNDALILPTKAFSGTLTGDRNYKRGASVRAVANDQAILLGGDYVKARKKAIQSQIPKEMRRFDDHLEIAAIESGFTKAFLARVGKTESMGNPNAKNGPYEGIMQLGPEAQKEMGIENPYDPKESIIGAARYLQCLRAEFKTDKLALAAYVKGPGWLRKNIAMNNGIKLPPEVKRYIEKIIQPSDYQG